MKLLIIGLDGATWKVIDPLLVSGEMPHLARLIQGGARCKNIAFEPVLSPIIWTSLASGKRPEKHGVTHFYDTSKNVRCKRLWDILGDQDRPVGIFAWPITWPPVPVNGFMIPSLFARDHDTYPPELRWVKELEDGLDKSWSERIRLISTATRHGLRPKTVLEIVNYVVGSKFTRNGGSDHFASQRIIKQKIHLDIFSALVSQYNPYFASFYLNQIDAFSHRYWHYYEPHLFPDVDAEGIERFGNMIPNVYKMTDDALGQLLELTDDDTLIVVLSDHGFEAALNAEKLDIFVARLLGDKLLDALNLTSNVKYVNHKDMLVLKVLRQRQEVLELLRAIDVEGMNQPLLDVYEEDTGELLIRVGKTANYKGVDLDKLHIVWPGGRQPFLELVETRFSSKPGVHHPDGIVVFYGPGVKPGGRVEDGSVLDITPTVLALLGEPVGRDMDGRVLEEVIDPEYLKNRPITYIDTHDADLQLEDIDEDDVSVSEEFMARLRDLGYVE